MGTRIRTCGNSLALRISKRSAEAAGLEANVLAQPAVSDHSIVGAPLGEEGLTLEDLLSRETDENRHGEVSAGRSVGLEAR